MNRTARACARCVVGVLLTFVLCAFAPATRTSAAGDGVGRSGARAKKKPRRRGARQTGTVGESTPVKRVLALPPTPMLDAAGIKQLLARGTPPNERPLLVNFWATWCEPCRIEFPDLVKIDQDYRARGLDFVAISVDDPSEAATGVPQFLHEMKALMPAYVLNVPDSEPVINAVDPRWGGELPATFLFDRRGQIVFNHKGRVELKDLRPAIEKALREQ